MIIVWKRVDYCVETGDHCMETWWLLCENVIITGMVWKQDDYCVKL